MSYLQRLCSFSSVKNINSHHTNHPLNDAPATTPKFSDPSRDETTNTCDTAEISDHSRDETTNTCDTPEIKLEEIIIIPNSCVNNINSTIPAHDANNEKIFWNAFYKYENLKDPTKLSFSDILGKQLRSNPILSILMPASIIFYAVKAAVERTSNTYDPAKELAYLTAAEEIFYDELIPAAACLMKTEEPTPLIELLDSDDYLAKTIVFAAINHFIDTAPNLNTSQEKPHSNHFIQEPITDLIDSEELLQSPWQNMSEKEAINIKNFLIFFLGEPNSAFKDWEDLESYLDPNSYQSLFNTLDHLISKKQNNR